MAQHFLVIRATAVGLAVLALAASAQAQVGKRFPSEKTVIKDAVTGVTLNVLTDGKASDSKIYQTHPQWTADGKYIIFRSSQRSPGSQAYAVNEETGDIIQLTEGRGNVTGLLNIARKSMKLYFVRNATEAASTAPASEPVSAGPATSASASTQPAGRGGRAARGGTLQIIELNLANLFADSEAGHVKPAASYERVCATLPQGLRDGGGLALDADEKFAYMSVTGGDVGQNLPPGVKVLDRPTGARMGAGPGSLRSINLETGEVKLIIDTPFQIGHVQTNPWVTGEIVYCWETGGDAPQRMWTTKADGSGNHPLFEEGPLDWVTHEAVITKDEVMFNLIGHQSRLRVRPTGIAVINLRTNAIQLLGQIDERQPDPNELGVNAAGPNSYGGFWHCNGSHDGRWAAGDTFGGNVWLIDRTNGKRTLLTTDHKMKPDHCHPTFDDATTKILIQSGHFTDGQRLSLIVIPIPADLK